MSLRVTDSNEGAHSKGEFLGMEGNSAWYAMGGVGAAIMTLLLLYGVFSMNIGQAVGLSVLPLVVTVAYVFALKNHKPENYDTDWFEAQAVALGLLPWNGGSSLASPRPGRRPRPLHPFAEIRRERSSTHANPSR